MTGLTSYIGLVSALGLANIMGGSDTQSLGFQQFQYIGTAVERESVNSYHFIEPFEIKGNFESESAIRTAQDEFSGEMTLEDALSILNGVETPDGENKIGLPESVAKQSPSADKGPIKPFDNQFEDEILGMSLVMDEALLPLRAQIFWMEKDASRILAAKDKKRATIIISESTGHRFTKEAISALPEGVVLALWPDSKLLDDELNRPYVLMAPPTERVVEKTFKPLIYDTTQYNEAAKDSLGFFSTKDGKLDLYETLLTPVFQAMARNGKTLYLESRFSKEALQQNAAREGADFGYISMRLDMSEQEASWRKFVGAIQPNSGGIVLAVPSPSELDGLTTLLNAEKGDVILTAVLPENQNVVLNEY